MSKIGWMTQLSKLYTSHKSGAESDTVSHNITFFFDQIVQEINSLKYLGLIPDTNSLYVEEYYETNDTFKHVVIVIRDNSGEVLSITANNLFEVVTDKFEVSRRNGLKVATPV